MRTRIEIEADMEIIKSSVSMDGMKVAIVDAGSDHRRLWAIFDFRNAANCAEDFAAEGVAFVHLYTFADDVLPSVVEFLTARNELNLTTIRESATISQLEETVRQEERNAQDFQEHANKQPARAQEYRECAALALDRKEEAELTIKVIKEAAQYTEFGKEQDD